MVKVQYVSGIQYFVEFDGAERVLFQKIIKGLECPSSVALHQVIMDGLVSIGEKVLCKEQGNELERND